VWRRVKDRLKGAEPDQETGISEPSAELVDRLAAYSERLRTLPPRRWRAVEDQVRRRSYVDPVGLEGWLGIGPKDVEGLGALCPDPLLAYALMCMHPSGYVREHALRAVVNTPTAERVLPILILRSSDWVAPVRSLAIGLLDQLRRDLPSSVARFADR
jgi:hypothetical protein